MPKILAKLSSSKRSTPAQEAAICDDALAGRLWDLVSAQAPLSLTDAERRRIGGAIFVGAPQVVRGVADGLETYPALFPAAATRAAKLRSAQKRALHFLSLHHHLTRLARLCADSYLQAQGDAIGGAMQVIEEARHDARDPALSFLERLPGGPAYERQLALADALRILGTRARLKDRKRAARGRAAALQR